MSVDVYGVKPGDHIPGAVLHRYLTDFARTFGVLQRLQFQVTVSVVEATPSGGWKLTVRTPEGERTVETEKLILAIGLTSTPNMPGHQGIEDFGNPLFHAKDSCRRATELEGTKNVVVVGGAKPGGNGPVWIAARFLTPLKRRVETILNVRFMSWFSPCPWGHEDGYGHVRWFLHNTAVGRMLVSAFWRAMGNDILSQNRYDSHPELQKLKSWHPVFWMGSGLSILNYNTCLFDRVRDGKIRVHVDNVDRLEPGKVVLTSGRCLRADALICSTGWNKESSITFAGLDKVGLRLPFSGKEQNQLNEEFDARILQQFPVLKAQPLLWPQPKPEEPLRHYRFMVPSAMMGQRNLAFAGMISSVSTAICASVQGLWISAYLGGKLEREAQSQEGVTQEVMLHKQWGKWRYPCGYGSSLPDLVLEGIPCVDMLLKDMGLKNHGKSSLYQGLVSPYTPRDYDGLFDEWSIKLEDSTE